MKSISCTALLTQQYIRPVWDKEIVLGFEIFKIHVHRLLVVLLFVTRMGGWYRDMEMHALSHIHAKIWDEVLYTVVLPQIEGCGGNIWCNVLHRLILCMDNLKQISEAWDDTSIPWDLWRKDRSSRNVIKIYELYKNVCLLLNIDIWWFILRQHLQFSSIFFSPCKI